MLKAKTTNGVYIFGLTAENVKRLKEGEPIVINLAELGKGDRAIILYGETHQDLLDTLQASTDVPLPEPIEKPRTTH